LTNYTEQFYERLRSGVERSATVMVPLALSATNARSVVDVGCGSGTWLRSFQAHGVQDILGIDGGWVRDLEIDRAAFLEADLTTRVRVDRQFDLAVSLEVGEHLPPESASTLVESLVSLAPVVMFSAAIPEQGGVDHVNEQWPEYWEGYFNSAGYLAVDYMRPRIWERSEVETWYIQNTIFYVDERKLADYPQLFDTRKAQPRPLAMVHPRHYKAKLASADDIYAHLDPNYLTLSALLRLTPPVAKKAILRRLRTSNG